MTDLPDVKLRALVPFPVSVTGRTGINVVKVNGRWYIDLDVSGLVRNANIPADQVANKWVTIYDATNNSYQNVPYSLVATAGVADIDGHTGALDIGNGLQFTGDTLELVDSYIETFLPQVMAWKHGVSGDGTDQTTALQAIIDGLPAEGGEIYLRGYVVASTLDVSNRRCIRFVGLGGAGGGAGEKSELIITAGAISSANAGINLRNTNSVSFSRMGIRSTNAAFDGRLLDYGAATSPLNAAYMSIDDCSISSVSASGALLSLYGATDGQFNKVTFGGPGTHVALQSVEAPGFCNNHLFQTCTFTPSGSIYPVNGSGEGIVFSSCNFQASSLDGRARAWVSSGLQPFLGVTFFCCTFYDVREPNGEWLVGLWGDGFNVTGGCRFGGNSNTYAIDIGGGGGDHPDPEERGVRGVNITGNFGDGFEPAMILLSGSKANKTNVRGGIIGGNSYTGVGAFLSGQAIAELCILPNSIYEAPLQIGSHMAFMGLPAYASDAAAIAAGLDTGQVYTVGTALRIVV
jgi:hypothetical protein